MDELDHSDHIYKIPGGLKPKKVMEIRYTKFRKKCFNSHRRVRVGPRMYGAYKVLWHSKERCKTAKLQVQLRMMEQEGKMEELLKFTMTLIE